MDILSQTSVNVSWENISIPRIVNYTVYYKLTKIVGGQSEQSVTVPNSDSSVVIEELITGMEYQFQVAAIAKLEGAGQRSVPTKVALPTMPSNTLSSPPTPDNTNSQCILLCALNYHYPTGGVWHILRTQQEQEK